jgi:hypothetical protein
MRASIYKCSNHLGCTTGYHGDDIQVEPGMPAVCPECGKPLRPVRSPTNKVGAYLVNLISVACIIIGLWMAWPGIMKLWHRYVSPASTPAQPAK